MSYWTVCQTESQRERVAFKFLRAGGFTAYLPWVSVKQDRVAPLFPGYVFVQIVDRWWAARWSVGIVRMLMWDDQPAQVSEKVVAAIMKREGIDGLVKLPKARGLERGDRVRIVGGSFAGQLGLYEGMDGAARVCVLLELLGRSVPVTLGKGDIAAVETAGANAP